MNTSHPISSHIEGVDFGFLTTRDVRVLSVKRIASADTFDSLLHPVPGGLHDAALGAFMDNPCSTCHLTSFSGCPGHCGHIDLPLPVYHITFMDQLLRLLRGKCCYCHNFKLSRSRINNYVCQLRLIRCGLLKEAENMSYVVDSLGSATNSKSDSDSDHDVADLIARRNTYVKKAIKRAGISKSSSSLDEKSQAINEARRLVLKDFYSEITKGKKCPNCNGINPTYRKDRSLKFFRKRLSPKDKEKMRMTEKRYENPITVLRRRQRVSDKKLPNGVHSDEGVADLGASSDDDEDAEMTDAQDPDGPLIASETATMSVHRPNITQDTEEFQEYMTPFEVRCAMVLLFENEAEILQLIYSPNTLSKSLAAVDADMFFTQAIVVPPNRYRMEDKTGDSISESPKNSLYKNIIKYCNSLQQIKTEIDGTADQGPYRRRNFDDLQNAWVNLQGAVNALVDRDANPIQGAAGRANADGIKQNLEKKEGLFRKNMMGKRVNFAARSVISPDPNIETNEIGVPPVFAKKLTYPEPVTQHNYYDLKEAVINGPLVWPGAMAVENEFGQVLALRKKNHEERVALANQLLAPSNASVNGTRPKKVHRHLNNGDIVIMNRQPTLHKPSMMCHRARVLPGEKTIRMHYANCNTYNADFDGDEMNMHFPQNEIARAEAATIADTDHQYLSATAGKPLRGLIQDHITMGVWLTNRDTFFNREEYQQLLYASLRPEDGHTTSGSLLTVDPAIWKPHPLWTGKQVITTVLKNIQPMEWPGITLTSKSATDPKQWGPGSEENQVVVQDGHLLMGIMDKAQIGPAGGGLVNAVYETYGHTATGRLLSVLGRLLTKLLHMRAFSCGVEDLILTKEGDQARLENLMAAQKAGFEVAAKYVSLDASKIKPNSSELRRRLEQVLRDDSKQRGLDELSKTSAAAISSAVTAACLPETLIKRFPKNQMQAMTASGAKGSLVNANQISCNLGQQVLEGRRVPVMVSGKTLPCFKPFETSVRAGGYVVNRFLTGIRPQEYYFHTMAGREGLIDTAVKTSRSGYLQRCIVKGMEGLRVEYDTSVRDTDGSMIQFLYGEDGIDTTKPKYLNDFKFQAENFISLYNSLNIHGNFDEVYSQEAAEYNKTAWKKVRKTRNMAIMDPALAKYPPARHSGSTSEKFFAAKREYCETNPDGLLKKRKTDKGEVLQKNFEKLMDVKYLRSLVEPGDAVGVVAGQSIGEPSTQMTLNTFHLAGHAAKNVTLGIPRLREIVMTASAKISTPAMTLYPHPELSKDECERFAKSISRLPLTAVLDEVTVAEKLGKGQMYTEARIYKIRLDFFPSKEYCEEYAIKIMDVVNAITNKFVLKLAKSIRAELRKKRAEKILSTAKDVKSAAVPDVGRSSRTIEQHTPSTSRANREGRDEGSGSDDDDDDDGDASAAKRRGAREESVEFDAPDDEEAAFAEQIRHEDDIESDEEEETDEAPPPRSSPAPMSSDSEEEETTAIQAAERKVLATVAAERKSQILAKCNDLADFNFDDIDGKYCELTFEYPATVAKLLMLQHVEAAAHFATIQFIPGITSAVLATEKMKNPLTGEVEEMPLILTEGTNLIAMRDYQHIIDPTRFFTNDIVEMLRLYGVEAGRASIVREMHAVFSGHGISVDHRHLNLIADTMTRGGGLSPFNRNALKDHTSPLMKMSFETTVGFLKDAVLENSSDDLTSPSARIVTGRLGTVGTGAFDVLAPVRVQKSAERIP